MTVQEALTAILQWLTREARLTGRHDANLSTAYALAQSAGVQLGPNTPPPITTVDALVEAAVAQGEAQGLLDEASSHPRSDTIREVAEARLELRLARRQIHANQDRAPTSIGLDELVMEQVDDAPGDGLRARETGFSAHAAHAATEPRHRRKRKRTERGCHASSAT